MTLEWLEPRFDNEQCECLFKDGPIAELENGKEAEAGRLPFHDAWPQRQCGDGPARVPTRRPCARVAGQTVSVFTTPALSTYLAGRQTMS